MIGRMSPINKRRHGSSNTATLQANFTRDQGKQNFINKNKQLKFWDFILSFRHHALFNIYPGMVLLELCTTLYHDCPGTCNQAFFFQQHLTVRSVNQIWKMANLVIGSTEGSLYVNCLCRRLNLVKGVLSCDLSYPGLI